MKYHPTPEITAQSYFGLRDDVEKTIEMWLKREKIETMGVKAVKFYGRRLRLETVNEGYRFVQVDSIPYGDLTNLQRALQLRRIYN